MCSAFAPLVKNKAGDLSDVNNYRAIAIFNSCTKILELLLHNYFMSIHCDEVNDVHRFGFKRLHSTGACTFVLKSTVDYHVKKW